MGKISINMLNKLSLELAYSTSLCYLIIIEIFPWFSFILLPSTIPGEAATRMVMQEGRKVANCCTGPQRQELLRLCDESEILTNQLADLCNKGMVGWVCLKHFQDRFLCWRTFTCFIFAVKNGFNEGIKSNQTNKLIACHFLISKKKMVMICPMNLAILAILSSHKKKQQNLDLCASHKKKQQNLDLCASHKKKQQNLDLCATYLFIWRLSNSYFEITLLSWLSKYRVLVLKQKLWLAIWRKNWPHWKPRSRMP